MQLLSWAIPFILLIGQAASVDRNHRLTHKCDGIGMTNHVFSPGAARAGCETFKNYAHECCVAHNLIILQCDWLGCASAFAGAVAACAACFAAPEIEPAVIAACIAAAGTATDRKSV
ncbi:hypothetical protein COCVIDRAFT_21379 [Bipolaris victoriae FI3]|uniref:Extracellular membrane protein CFEM domain-containing protein n=1 Tax=Bipolaris victoriae (strain FI3) TaxID=930091 RepID=W7E8S0_BIPV3|nr:hypothetical protein COCVIDRAFT_21379 [Bipolaris victoriae FI3]